MRYNSSHPFRRLNDSLYYSTAKARTKQCMRCKEDKPLEQFGRTAATRISRKKICLSCENK